MLVPYLDSRTEARLTMTCKIWRELIQKYSETYSPAREYYLTRLGQQEIIKYYTYARDNRTNLSLYKYCCYTLSVLELFRYGTTLFQAERVMRRLARRLKRTGHKYTIEYFRLSNYLIKRVGGSQRCYKTLPSATQLLKRVQANLKPI